VKFAPAPFLPVIVKREATGTDVASSGSLNSTRTCEVPRSASIVPVGTGAVLGFEPGFCGTGPGLAPAGFVQ